MMGLKECNTCEATGFIYVGFGENDVKQCTDCEDGYLYIDPKKDCK